MSKVFFISNAGGFGERALIGDGKMLKFKFNGDCLGEFPIDYNLSTLQEVDIVSLLVEGSELEIGFNVQQQFTKKQPASGLADVANKLNNQQGLIFIGKRNGKNTDGQFVQYIYTFLKNSVNPSLFN